MVSNLCSPRSGRACVVSLQVPRHGVGYNWYCWGPLYVDGISYAVRALPLKHSFSRPRGIAKWAAQAAH